MLIVFCVITVLAVILHNVLAAGGWGAWLPYVAAHGGLTGWLLMQSSEGMSPSEQLGLGLLWLLIALYILVAAIVAVVRAVALLREGRSAAR